MPRASCVKIPALPSRKSRWAAVSTRASISPRVSASVFTCPQGGLFPNPEITEQIKNERRVFVEPTPPNITRQQTGKSQPPMISGGNQTAQHRHRHQEGPAFK